jgi:Domain of unknown function (DUF5667)
MQEREPTKTDITEPRDVLASQRIRSIQKVRPRASFRARVMFYSDFPALGVKAAERSAGRERVPEKKSRPAVSRGFVYAAAAVVVLVALFGGLTMAAGNAVPGDALYGFKKARESIELAFAGNGSGGAEKNLQLAETRMAELSMLVSKNQASPDRVESIARDFEAKTAAVDQVLQQGKAGDDAGTIATRLKNVTAQKDNVVRHLAAVEPSGLLAPVAAGKVRVTSGGRDHYYTTDATGKFDANAPDIAAGSETLVEADGRRQIMQVGDQAPATSNQPTARLENVVESLLVGKPQTLTAVFSKSDGTPASYKTVMLRDTTGTSSIDGRTGESVFETDANGKVSFSITKTSVDRMTKLAAVVEGVPGEVTIAPIGGLELPAGSTATPVAAIAFGPADNLSNVELDNGIVKVTFDRGVQGRIVSAVTRSGLSSLPLDDPLGAAPGASVSARLVASSGNSAAYEVSVTAPVAGGNVTRVWRVGLNQGEEFARMSCAFDKASNVASPDGDGLTVLNVNCPSTTISVSGRQYDASKDSEGVLLSFDRAAPYATCGSGASTTTIAVPVDSPALPAGWLVSSSTLGVRAQANMPALGASSKMEFLVTVGDQKSAEELGHKAVAGLGNTTVESSYDCTGEGFLLNVSDAGQKKTVGVYKKYKSAF